MADTKDTTKEDTGLWHFFKNSLIGRTFGLQDEGNDQPGLLGLAKESLGLSSKDNASKTETPGVTGWLRNSMLGRTFGLQDEGNNKPGLLGTTKEMLGLTQQSPQQTESKGLWSWFRNSMIGRTFGLQDEGNDKPGLWGSIKSLFGFGKEEKPKQQPKQMVQAQARIQPIKQAQTQVKTQTKDQPTRASTPVKHQEGKAAELEKEVAELEKEVAKLEKEAAKTEKEAAKTEKEAAKAEKEAVKPEKEAGNENKNENGDKSKSEKENNNDTAVELVFKNGELYFVNKSSSTNKSSLTMDITGALGSSPSVWEQQVEKPNTPVFTENQGSRTQQPYTPEQLYRALKQVEAVRNGDSSSNTGKESSILDADAYKLAAMKQWNHTA